MKNLIMSNYRFLNFRNWKYLLSLSSIEYTDIFYEKNLKDKYNKYNQKTKIKDIKKIKFIIYF